MRACTRLCTEPGTPASAISSAWCKQLFEEQRVAGRPLHATLGERPR